MTDSLHPSSFISLRCAAHRLGVPLNWLQSEAEKDQIPHLKVGRRLLFNLSAVEAELLRRSSDIKREVVSA